MRPEFPGAESIGVFLVSTFGLLLVALLVLWWLFFGRRL